MTLVNGAAVEAYQRSMAAFRALDYAPAIHHCTEALRLDPTNPTLLAQRARCWDYSREWLQALPDWEAALCAIDAKLRALSSGEHSTHAQEMERTFYQQFRDTAAISLAYSLFGAGEYARSFEAFESRRYNPEFQLAANRIASPKDIARYRDSTIVLQHEFGLGDSIQFSRYFPQWLTRAKQFIIRTPPTLLRLYQASFPEIEIISDGGPIPDGAGLVFDMSQPYLLQAKWPDSSQAFPYLRTGLTSAAKDRSAIRRVGIKWQCRPFDDRRYDLAEFIPLFEMLCGGGGEVPEIHSLEPLPPMEAEQAIAERFGLVSHVEEPSEPRLTDMLETAKLIETLDLVITVDTGVAHLAGALDVPTWILLPDCIEWRWRAGMDRTPWYPSMRIFRPQIGEPRASLVKRVTTELSEHLL